jgi:hypothetical protein
VSSDQKRVALQIFLFIVIVVLTYWLYVSITAPYEEIRAQEQRTERLRERMDLTATGLIRYRDRNARFPNTLDSLVTFVSRTPDVRAELDSTSGIQNFAADSLSQSPLTGNAFEYETSPDSARVDIYRLADPDSDAQIGSLELDPTQVNVPNWE